MSPKTFDPVTIRDQFPILSQQVNGYPLIYLDNAATSQKPQVVIDALTDYYTQDNANVHRGLHELSMRASNLYDETRQMVAEYLNAPAVEEVIFTSGCTESINIVAQCWVEAHFQPGNAVLVSELEHHSNIVPWQILAKKLGLDIRYLEVNDVGEVMIEQLPKLLQDGKVKLASLCWISNSLGTVNPIEDIIAACHQYGTAVLIDASQVPAHQAIDLQKLDCDFLTFSAHKVFGPTGVGVLWGRMALLEQFDYWMGGGDMIVEVSYDDFVANDIPFKFEAGTPRIAQVIGFGVALTWLSQIDLDAVAQHEHRLMQTMSDGLRQIEEVRIVGEAKHKASALSFCLRDNRLHPSDLATFLNLRGVAVRSGHHCTMPILKKMGLPATARASLAMYNTDAEIKQFIKHLSDIISQYA